MLANLTEMSVSQLIWKAAFCLGLHYPIGENCVLQSSAACLQDMDNHIVVLKISLAILML